jgi:hypothetical protein
LFKDDTQKILDGLRASTDPNDWVLKNTKKESTFLSIAQTISLFGRKVEADAKKQGFEAINMDDNFEQKIARLAAM